MLNFITIKDVTNSSDKFVRTVSITYGGCDKKIRLLGKLSHDIELDIDRENAKKLINLLLDVCIKSEVK